MGCEVGGDLPEAFWNVFHRWHSAGEVERVEPAASGLASAHVPQGPASPHGDEARQRPPSIEAGGVHLEEPTQRLLCRIVEVMGHTPAGPPHHASHHRHKLDNRHTEGFGDRVAWAAWWVRRWVASCRPMFHGHTANADRTTIVVVTKALPAPGVEPGLPLRGEGF